MHCLDIDLDLRTIKINVLTGALCRVNVDFGVLFEGRHVVRLQSGGRHDGINGGTKHSEDVTRASSRRTHSHIMFLVYGLALSGVGYSNTAMSCVPFVCLLYYCLAMFGVQI